MGIQARTLLLLCASFVTLALQPACSSHIPIQRIAAQPARFNEQRVVVKGRVTQTYALPMIGQSLVQIEDGTGALWVKPLGRVPFEGQEIVVEGTLKIGMTLANRNFGVVIYEEAARD